MLFVTRDGTPPHIEDLEERVVEALRFTLLVGRVPPLVSEFGGAGTNFVPGQAHGLRVSHVEHIEIILGLPHAAYR